MFYVPTGTDNAIDTCDVVIATSAGGACNVTLLDGSVIRVGALVDDFAAELNALYPPGEPFIIGPLPLGGTQTVWLAANKVQRVQPARDPLQSFVSMLSLRSLLAVPAPVSDVVLFLNTTSGCGGGGGAGGGGVYGNSGKWVPVVTPGPGNTVDPNLNFSALFTRLGPFQPPPVVPAPAPGDMLQLQCEFWCVLLAGNPLSFEVFSLPGPIENGFFTATWNATRISGDAFNAEEIRFNRGGGGDSFTCATNNWAPVTDTTIRLDCVVTYPVDGV